MIAAPTTQQEFDWLTGFRKPWLEAKDVADRIECSPDHVWNLITDGSLDFAIDIKTEGSRRPAFRVFWDSFIRFLAQQKHPHRLYPATNFEQLIGQHLSPNKNILTSAEVSAFLSCTERHVINLGSSISLDLSSAGAMRCYPRTTRSQLIAFIQGRKL